MWISKYSQLSKIGERQRSWNFFEIRRGYNYLTISGSVPQMGMFPGECPHCHEEMHMYFNGYNITPLSLCIRISVTAEKIIPRKSRIFKQIH